MAEDPIQILEVRAPDAERPATVTAAVTRDAAHAVFIALSEQLDRRRQQSTESVEDLLALRRRTELVERFAPLAEARAHAIVQFTDEELRDCLLDLNDYRERVDGEHYQPPELRERLRVTGEMIAILWDANASVAATVDPALTRTCP
jgi:hypothetical protein